MSEQNIYWHYKPGDVCEITHKSITDKIQTHHHRCFRLPFLTVSGAAALAPETERVAAYVAGQSSGELKRGGDGFGVQAFSSERILCLGLIKL